MVEWQGEELELLLEDLDSLLKSERNSTLSFSSSVWWVAEEVNSVFGKKENLKLTLYIADSNSLDKEAF